MIVKPPWHLLFLLPLALSCLAMFLPERYNPLDEEDYD